MGASVQDYLGADGIVESTHPGVVELAAKFRANTTSDAEFAKAAYEWVRDHIGHSVDAGDFRLTLTAGEVLTQRVGLCFAKSHLLVAILRAAGIPAGMCYQRLQQENGFALHGLMAVYLDGRWYRQDPRGNKPGITAEFSLQGEQLAYQVDPTKGEVDYPTVFAHPAPVIIQAYAHARNAQELCDTGLPDSLPS